jgi:hypothetical protein
LDMASSALDPIPAKEEGEEARRIWFNCYGKQHLIYLYEK